MSCLVGSGLVRWGRIGSCGVLSWHVSPCRNLFVLVVQWLACLALFHLILTCLAFFGRGTPDSLRERKILHERPSEPKRAQRGPESPRRPEPERAQRAPESLKKFKIAQESPRQSQRAQKATERFRELHSRTSKIIWFRPSSSIAAWCCPAVWCGLLPFDVVWCLEWSGVVWCFVGVVCSLVCLVSSGIVWSRLVSSIAVCGRMLSCVGFGSSLVSFVIICHLRFLGVVPFRMVSSGLSGVV